MNEWIRILLPCSIIVDYKITITGNEQIIELAATVTAVTMATSHRTATVYPFVGICGHLQPIAVQCDLGSRVQQIFFSPFDCWGDSAVNAALLFPTCS